MTDLMKKGVLSLLEDCPNLIREIEGYVWDPKLSEKGIDAPFKRDDHSVDALRYACATHKVKTYDPYNSDDQPGRFRNPYDPFRR
jgi:phage terminase large subunit